MGADTTLHDVLDCFGNIVYAVDAETWDTLYVNEAAAHCWSHSSPGNACYEVIRGRTEPCPWCPIFHLERDVSFHFDSVHDVETDRYFTVDCHRVAWGDKDAYAIIATDITPNIRTQMALEEAQSRYRLAVEGSDIHVWEYDLDTRRITAPAGMLAHVGLPDVVENAPESLMPLFGAANQRRVMALFEALQSGVAEASDTLWFKTRGNGEAPRCEQLTFRTVFDKRGEPIKAYAVSENVSVREFERERYDRLIHDLIITNPRALGTFHLNLSKNRCGEGRSSSEHFLELQSKGTVDGFFTALVDDMGYDIDRKELSSALSREVLLDDFMRGRVDHPWQYRRTDDEGRLRWTLIHFVMRQNPYTLDIEALAYAIDIDDQVISQQIITNMMGEEYDLIMLVVNKKSRIEFRNVSELGGTQGEWGKWDYDTWLREAVMPYLVDEDPEEFLRTMSLDAVFDCLESRGKFAYAFSMRTDTGEVRRKIQRCSYLRKTDRALLVLRIDVTESYLKEQDSIQRLREALDAAETAGQAKSEFLSRMSHDIRTPMNGIIGMTHIAQENDNPPATEDCLAKIEISSEFLLGLVNNILDLAKVNEGAIELHPEPYPIDDFIGYLDALIRPLAEQKRLSFTVEGEVHRELVPLIDRLRMNQIVFNLLSNAVKYTSAGGSVLLRLDTKPLDAEHMSVSVIISDTGIGISEAYRKLMFDPFSRGGDSPEESQGTGLGLAIVKKMVDLMGGTIEVESEVGKGTTFDVRLMFPCLPADEALEHAEEIRMQASLEKLNGKHMLVCEDNELNTEIIKHVLETAGMSVVTVPNGRLGVEAFIASKPGYFDAVLMDIRMPEMDGLQATREIRASSRPDSKTVPIIAMSANAYDEDREKSRQAGMNAHLAKPVDTRHVLEVLAVQCG